MIAAVIVGPRVSKRDSRVVERGVCGLDIVLHRVQACQLEEDNRLSEGVVPDLIKIALTSLYSFRCGRRTPERS